MPLRAHRWMRLAAVMLAHVLGGLAALPVAAVAGPGRAVTQTRESLETAEEQLARQTEALDAAVETYERARAHHLRLKLEADASGPALRAQRREQHLAERAFADRVAEEYKHPLNDLAVIAALLHAPDVTSALRQIDLTDQMTSAAAAHLSAHRSSTARLTDVERQQRVLVASTRAAADHSRQAAQALTRTVAAAEHEVADAEHAVAEARAEAERRRKAAAAVRRAAAEAAARVAQPASGVPGALAGSGASCPVGSPNGFIDSWGFPRSGGRTHQGVDVFAAAGMPVYAAEAGVAEASTNTLGGQVVYLHADDGDTYYYAHLAFESVTDGVPVPAGAVLGGVGTSGNAAGTPPHLHWEYHPRGGEPVNPYPLATSLCR